MPSLTCPLLRPSLLVDNYVETQKEYKQQVLLSAEAQLERLEELEASKKGLATLKTCKTQNKFSSVWLSWQITSEAVKLTKNRSL